MVLLDITLFAGHLHPLVVHLPIGFILLSAIFDILSYTKKYEVLKPAVSISLLMGFISALLASFFGYVLSTSGEYEHNALRHHGFSGIILTLVLGILYIITSGSIKSPARISNKLFSVTLVGIIILMGYSGHQGASLTHGNDYLTVQTLVSKVRDKPTNLDSVLIYEDVVQPIIQNKCRQCHNEGKLKGNLSVESLQALYKGGKNGPAIVGGKLSESELYKRIILDPDNKDFMPRDGKAPLTKQEVKIIKWWIEEAGAISGKRVSDFKNTNVIKTQLAFHLGIGENLTDDEGEPLFTQEINPDIPLLTDTQLVSHLRKKGLMVRFMLKKPVMLDITLPPNSGVKAMEFRKDILPLARNIIWLNLSSNNFTDGDLVFLKDLTNLEKLRLDRNPLTGEVSNSLSALNHLESVNFNQTNITDAAIAGLKKNTTIKNIYTWGTAARQSN